METAGDGGDALKGDRRRNARPRMVLPPNCMPDGDCIFYRFCPRRLSLSLSLVLFLLSSLTVSSLPSFQQYFRATHPLATPTHGTPARKRGVRNVIAPLRRVSWYKAVLLLLILLSSSSRPPLPVKNVRPEGTSDRSVLRVEFVTQCPLRVLSNINPT